MRHPQQTGQEWGHPHGASQKPCGSSQNGKQGLRSVRFVVLGGDPAAAVQQDQGKDNLNLDAHD